MIDIKYGVGCFPTSKWIRLIKNGGYEFLVLGSGLGLVQV